MKKQIIGLVLVFILLQFSYTHAYAQKPLSESIKTATNNSPAERALIQLSHKKWNWMADKNVDSLKTLFDDKAMFVHMGGSWGKEPELKTIKNGDIWYKKAQVYSVIVHIIGNTAILLNDIDLEAVVGGNTVTNAFMVTEVYVKENGTWKMGSLTFSHLLRPVKMNTTNNPSYNPPSVKAK